MILLGWQSEKARRMELMRKAAAGEKDGGPEQFESSKQWDNDDYIMSLRRPASELHQVLAGHCVGILCMACFSP